MVLNRSMLKFHWETILCEDFILKFQRKAPELSSVRFQCKTYRKQKAFCLLDKLFLGIQHTSSLSQKVKVPKGGSVSKTHEVPKGGSGAKHHEGQRDYVFQEVKPEVKMTTLSEYETVLVKSALIQKRHFPSY